VVEVGWNAVAGDAIAITASRKHACADMIAMEAICMYSVFTSNRRGGGVESSFLCSYRRYMMKNETIRI